MQLEQQGIACGQCYHNCGDNVLLNNEIVEVFLLNRSICCLPKQDWSTVPNDFGL